MRKYRLVAKKGEGTFSEVLKAQNVIYLNTDNTTFIKLLSDKHIPKVRLGHPK